MSLEDEGFWKGFTLASAVVGNGKVHALMGGGPGLLDDQGRRRYFQGWTRCRVEKRSSAQLVETDQPVTCKSCLRAMTPVSF